MIALPEKAREVLEDVLADVRERPRYRGGYVVDEDGYSHPWGAATAGSERMGQACGTKKDLRYVQKALREVGVPLAIDDVDNLLSEAIWRDGEGLFWYDGPISKAERARDKRRRRVVRLREAGLCIVCGNVRLETGRSCCYECGVRANARKKKVSA